MPAAGFVSPAPLSVIVVLPTINWTTAPAGLEANATKPAIAVAARKLFIPVSPSLG
jgi:hypothetical protein